MDFKIGVRVACYVSHGSYARYWESPETIVRETKTLWVTDKGSRFYKTDGYDFGSRGDSLHSRVYHVWTTEMEIRRQQNLLKKGLEAEISKALSEHKFTVVQLQYIKQMLREQETKENT